MFGGLTKTSSRIAIAAALGLVVGGFAFKATPARAADLGGDCCADLEERVAELEATTVRKGNKKVSVTLSGWVVKSFNWWDDGDLDRPMSATRATTLAPASPSPAVRRSHPVGLAATTSRSTPGARSSPPAAPRWASRDWRFRSVRRRRLRPPELGGRVLRLDQHALLVHVYQERQVGHPELGSSEPGF